MKIAEITDKPEQTLEEAFTDKNKLLTLHGINPDEVNNFDNFADYVNRQKEVNPSLYRKIVSMD